MAIQIISDGSGDGVGLGQSTSDLINLYGGTPVSQRASSHQVTTAVVTSASYGTLQVAQMQEVMNTLAAIGAWKGSA